MQKATPIAVVALVSAIATTSALGQTEAPADQAASPAEKFVQQLDTNSDGAVTLDEAKAPQKEQFSKMDADSNGSISAEEASNAFKSQVPPEMLEAMKERGMPDPGETFVKNLDTNGDGSVDATEFEQPTEKSFADMDADGDGNASKEEASAYFDKLREQMQQQMQQMQQMQEQQEQEQAPAK
ncbi:MAG: EF-hand domain-containing protein [Thiohalocapsa sp.]